MIGPGLVVALCMTQLVSMSNLAQIRTFPGTENIDADIPQTSIFLVNPGDIFTIRLEANATTGYEWNLTNLASQDICQLVSSEYEPSDSNRIGAGGHQVWTFLALKRGETDLVFEYLRSWEPGIKPVNTHTACVVVW